MRGIVTAVVMVVVSAAGAFAQESSRLTDQQRLLELKAAWVELEHAESERDRARRLADLGLASEADLAAADTAHQVAQVRYQQRFLELFAATPRVAVVRCVKRYQPDDRQEVVLTLRNGSAPALDWESVGVVSQQVPMPDLDRLREIRNVVVSLTDLDGTVISEPYERVVPRLGAEETLTLSFVLLQDVDALRVVLRYGGREAQVLPVRLERDRTADVVRLASQQFSQEADLGSAAVYDLRLERYGGAGAAFALLTFELPEEVGAEFLDPGTGARLSQIRFTEGSTSRNLQLKIHLPDMVSDDVALDQPLEFLVAAVPAKDAARLGDGRSPGEGVLDDVRRSSTRLELVPRGVGRLEVTAPTLYARVEPGETARLEIVLRNIGTRRVDNVRLHADGPSDWRATVEPSLAERLAPGETLRIDASLATPPDVEVGDYPVRLRTEAYADSRRIASHDQTARIQVVAPASWLATVLLVSLLVGCLGGLVLWGVRLSRR